MRLSGTVSLVMGASRGIGAATARQLAAEGAAVVLVARSREPLDMLAAEIRSRGGTALPMVRDLSDPDAAASVVSEALANFGRIDHLINNAAVIEPVATLHDASPGAWARAIRTNLGGVFLNCRAVLPVFQKAGRGVIIHLSSGAAHRPVEGWSAYCVSKASTLMLTLCLAVEEGQIISVYALQPGAVDTEILAQVRQAGLSEYSSRPRETLLSPELPARVITWLCSERPADLSGQEITIRDPALRARVGLPDGNYA
jgi:NAD(P)-dependent dehydrogenase (short-subunit alcohol dehydrogenase family)